MCVYRKHSADVGQVKQHGSDIWVDLRLDHTLGSEIQIVLEFGAKWIIPRDRSSVSLRPAVDLSFHTSGSVRVYIVPANVGETVAFHTYRMPCAGNFHKVVFHTHAQLKSSLWILNVAASRVLRPLLNTSADSSNGKAVPLSHIGSIKDIQTSIYIRASHSIVCRYQSHAVVIDHQSYTRSGLQDKFCTARWGRWRFVKDDYVSLIAFNDATGFEFHQHHAVNVETTFDALP